MHVLGVGTHLIVALQSDLWNPGHTCPDVGQQELYSRTGYVF